MLHRTDAWKKCNWQRVPCKLTQLPREPYGYGTCNVMRHGKRIKRGHVVAWIDYHNRLPQPGHQINHLCDNPPCEEPLHLYAGTKQQNAEDARRANTLAVGERNGQHKLSNAEVIEIRNRYGGYRKHPNARELAAEYGVTRSLVNRILRGERWDHIVT